MKIRAVVGNIQANAHQLAGLVGLIGRLSLVGRVFVGHGRGGSLGCTFGELLLGCCIRHSHCARLSLVCMQDNEFSASTLDWRARRLRHGRVEGGDGRSPGARDSERDGHRSSNN